MTKKIANIIVFTILIFSVLCLVLFTDIIVDGGLYVQLDELLNPYY